MLLLAKTEKSKIANANTTIFEVANTKYYYYYYYYYYYIGLTASFPQQPG